MLHLSLALLGPIQVLLDGQPITPFTYDKVAALLAYLAVEAGRAHEREALMGLLWPDLPEDAARNNLRQALVKLRDAIGDRGADPPFLLTSRAALQFDRASHYQLDVSAFAELVDSCDRHIHRHPASCKSCAQALQQAVALYQGAFLAEFFLPDSAAFEEWALVKREALHRRMVDALERLTAYHERRSQYGQALEYAQRQLALDPWGEELHRQVMRLHVLNGDRSAALAQYESCRRILAAELDVEPEAETVALHEQIHNGEVRGHTATPTIQNPKSKIQNRLPPQLTPFIGRETELIELNRLLDRPECRLLTVTGPGGIGKTRLVLQVATDHLGDFADGVFFVPLDGVTTADFLPHAILTALGTPLQPQQPADEQVCLLLQKQEVLLVLDNYEQLLPDVELLLKFARSAPGVVLLVTSRERLALQAEWLFALEGLSYPPADKYPDKDESADEYEAVQLFVQRVRQTQRGFTLSDDERRDVQRICQLVEGMPLAIELAAAVVREQSCATLLAALERGHFPAAASLRDQPNRHHSVEAIFAHSWRLLTLVEQGVLRALSVFHGGFLAEAAQAVAGASATSLAALVDKSLLRRNRAGRYNLHELVRQYAHEQLELCGEWTEIQKGYTQYFLRFAEEAECGLGSSQPAKWLTYVEQEIDNLRAVLKWLTRHAPEDALRITVALFWFWQTRGHLQEGNDWFAVTLTYPDTGSSHLRARGYNAAGFLAICTNKIDEAEQLFAKSLALYQQLDATDQQVAEGKTRLLARLSLGPLFRGDYEQALRVSLQNSSIFFAAEAYYHQGLFAQSKANYEQSLRYSQAIGNQRSCGRHFTRLGHVVCAQHEFAQAASLFKKGLTIGSECQDQPGIGFALLGLARIAIAAGHYQRATLLLAVNDATAAFNPIIRFWPMDRKETALALATLHAHLDDATFAAAWAAGCALSLEQAVAYALTDEAESPPG
jgi:predicted ATPase/DNA-binding SARP family transcriptional activator